MSRKISLVLFVFLFATLTTFSAVIPDEDGEGYAIPQRISNNAFFLESLRLGMLALETYDFGDYDASAGFAEEAIRFAHLSDEFVSNQLIMEARRLLDWAQSHNFSARYPGYYSESLFYYDMSTAAFSMEDWDVSIKSAISSIEILLRFESGETLIDRPLVTPAAAVTPQPPARDDGTSPLPSQYTVRTWAVERDCLWNIAGYPWVYGDSRQWRELYNANRSRMPDPNNPDLIRPGFVLDIPSIRGEFREGMWDPAKTYRP